MNDFNETDESIVNRIEIITLLRLQVFACIIGFMDINWFLKKKTILNFYMQDIKLFASKFKTKCALRKIIYSEMI